MINGMIILQAGKISDKNCRSASNNQPNKTRCRDHLVKTKNEKDGESSGLPNDSLVTNNSATNSPSRYAPISIIFVLCCMIGIISFGEYLFVCRGILNENENANLNCVFVNVICKTIKYDNFCDELLLCYIPNLADKFSNTGAVLLSQNNILAYIFGIEYNMIWIYTINSGKCCDNMNEYYQVSYFYCCYFYYQLSYLAPAHTPACTTGCTHQPTIVFNYLNQNGIRKAGIDILDGIFGIGLCDNKYENQICNDMFQKNVSCVIFIIVVFGALMIIVHVFVCLIIFVKREEATSTLFEASTAAQVKTKTIRLGLEERARIVVVVSKNLIVCGYFIGIYVCIIIWCMLYRKQLLAYICSIICFIIIKF